MEAFPLLGVGHDERLTIVEHSINATARIRRMCVGVRSLPNYWVSLVGGGRMGQLRRERDALIPGRVG
jgi:hypothetical protein